MKTLRLLFIIFISVFSSCSDSNKDSSSASINQTKNPKENKTDKIIIAECDGASDYESMRIDSLNQIDESLVIENFEQLLESLKKPNSGEYCCCPSYHYSLSFYDKNKNYKTYYVDTSRGDQIAYGPLEYGIDGVLIYASNYNYCRKIPYSEWQKFASCAKKITYKKYITSDLKQARKLFSYANHNNLAIINSDNCSDEWPYFDGQFSITVSESSEQLVYDNMRKEYSTDSFKIGISNSPVKDFFVHVSCNYPLYEKFDMYSKESNYTKYWVSILLLGNEKELSGIDSIVEIAKL